MKILIDTNVVADIILERKPFYIDSLNSIKKCLYKGDRCYISALAVTDLYYIVKKIIGKQEALLRIAKLLKVIYVAEVNNECIYKSFISKISDYEDAVVEAVAERINANLIITRNAKDFKNCKIKVIDPKEFVYEN